MNEMGTNVSINSISPAAAAPSRGRTGDCVAHDSPERFPPLDGDRCRRTAFQLLPNPLAQQPQADHRRKLDHADAGTKTIIAWDSVG